jgi:uncharacterized protein
MSVTIPGSVRAASSLTTVIMLAKAPVPGMAKTRMCPPCTNSAAAALAEASLFDTADVIEMWAGPRLLSLERCGTNFVLPGWPTVEQCPGGLAERLDYTFKRAFSDAFEAKRVFLVGMDTPQLTLAHLISAEVALEQANVVLGPAADGGYWGIGANRYVHGLFDDVEMSTAHTFEAQMEQAKRLGQTVGTLDVLRDIDTFDDAVEIGRKLPGSRVGRLIATDQWWAQER